MLQKLMKMPGSMAVIIIWVVVWCLVIIKNVDRNLAGKGNAFVVDEYYRFITAGLTHTNLIHLLTNISALLWLGYVYEEHMGTLKFLLVAFICAVACQVIFLTIYKNALNSFGGSGYCFALSGFCLTMQFLDPQFPKIQLGTWSGNWLTVYLVVSNLPVLSFINGTTVIFHAIAFSLGVIAALMCRFLRIT